MRRSVLIAIIFAAGILVSAASEARAQDDETRWEVGAHYTGVDFGKVSPVGSAAESESFPAASGFGGRVGYNFNSNVAVEAEVNYFPSDRFLEGGRKTQGLFGVRVGKRFDSVGIYAKARPGFLRLSRGEFRPLPGVICITPLPACHESEPTASFAFDAGGVVELYPSSRTFVRLDAGDTMVRFGRRLAPVRSSNNVFINDVEGETTHNFQGGVGFGFRF
jgi:hypothetical protein